VPKIHVFKFMGSNRAFFIPLPSSPADSALNLFLHVPRYGCLGLAAASPLIDSLDSLNHSGLGGWAGPGALGPLPCAHRMRKIYMYNVVPRYMMYLHDRRNRRPRRSTIFDLID